MKLSTPEQQLQHELNIDPTHTLWLADENALGVNLSEPVAAAVTNRWDIYQHAQAQQRWFTDWDLQAALTSGRYRRVIYRVSKERPVVHHLLNQLADHWQQWDELLLIGQKNEGLKSFADQAGKRFGNKQLKKQGNHYTASIASREPTATPLDTQDYARLRETARWGDLALLSKPGTFGWQKIDEGSCFLLEQLAQLAPELPPARRVLDLGCGYGFITLGARQLLPSPAIHWLGTDNCAAALQAYAANCGAFAEGFAGDRGLDVNGKPLKDAVDLVLCNPPFHQGFSPSGDITQRFVTAMHQWLTPKGTALVVVNQFVGLEKPAKALFGEVREIANNGSFRVLRLVRGR